MRWARVVFASSIVAAAGCASILGIEDTVDDVTPGGDGSVDTGDPGNPGDDGSTKDDGSSSTEVPVDPDASMQADVANIDAAVTMTCPENGLVARWKLDEIVDTNKVLDCSGNGLHGEVTNGTLTSNGADGGALKFSGNGRVGFANPALLRLTAAFTVSMWLRPDRNVANTEYVFGKTTDPAKNGYRLGIITNQQLALATPSSSSNFNVVGGNLTVGVWRHVAAVYRPGDKTELFVNGTKVGNANDAPAALIPSNAEARLAARVDNQYGFSGAISDVRVYSRALSAAEITALAQR